mmetsp:Transcript_45788/g.133328  ORF Transcript_45788/g.133328 Transcript_45788/m.133328 type:complete len:265 (+) Transcript_45788:435-1229(+)
MMSTSCCRASVLGTFLSITVVSASASPVGFSVMSASLSPSVEPLLSSRRVDEVKSGLAPARRSGEASNSAPTSSSCHVDEDAAVVWRKRRGGEPSSSTLAPSSEPSVDMLLRRRGRGFSPAAPGPLSHCIEGCAGSRPAVESPICRSTTDLRHVAFASGLCGKMYTAAGARGTAGGARLGAEAARERQQERRDAGGVEPLGGLRLGSPSTSALRRSSGSAWKKVDLTTRAKATASPTAGAAMPVMAHLKSRENPGRRRPILKTT